MSGTEIDVWTSCIKTQSSKDVSKAEDIQQLREWLPKQPHLPPISDGQLIVFLHCCYGSIEKVKKTINHYYLIRNAALELFFNLDPLQPCIQNAFKVVNYVRLPKSTPKEGYSIYYCRLADTDPANYDFFASIKTFIICTDVQLFTQPLAPGYIIVLDAKGVALGHIPKINIALLKKYLTYVQEAMPVRLKQIHILNASSLVDKIYAMIKPFLKGELIEMIHFHSPGDMSSFYKDVPKEILPKDLGGDSETIQYHHDKNKQHVESHREFLQALEKNQKIDESKRPEQTKGQSEIFGMEGSFRKLSID